MTEGAASHHPLLAPRSIALVGATEAEHKLAGRRWRSLVEGGFEGTLYPVHPSATSIRGIRAFPDLDAVPEPVDLVIVAVPASAVAGVARQCVHNGARAVVVMSGGFAESGDAGRRMEEEVAAILADAGIPMIGPNCAGMASAPSRINLMGWHAPAGAVGVISQSGNIALNLGYLARLHGGGFSRIFSIGNARSTGVVALLDLLLHDASTKAVIVYIEGWRDGEGRAFMDVVISAGSRKPIVLMNPGRTVPGRHAAMSHTGALAAPERIVAGVADALGLLRTDDPEVAWHAAHQLAQGRRLAHGDVLLLTDGGGHATLVSEALGEAELSLRQLNPELRSALKSSLPPICSIGNPLDFAGVAEGEPETVAATVARCVTLGGAGAVLMAGHFGGYHRVGGEAVRVHEVAAAQRIAQIAGTHRAPVMLHSVHAGEPLDTFAPLRDAGVMVTASPRCLGHVAGLLHRANTPTAREAAATQPEAFPRERVSDILEHAVAGEERWLMEPESRALLASLGLPLPTHEVAGSVDEARTQALSMLLSTPAGIVMKRIAPDAPHKSDGGGVRPGIRTPAEIDAVLNQFTAMGGACRILVSTMLCGAEVAVGGVNDPQFGPCVMLGAGGTALELHGDVVFRPAPLAPIDPAAMVRSLRMAPLLDGYRGGPAADHAALHGLLRQVGHALARCPWIAAIDLNPVFVDHQGARVADARVVLCA